MIFCCSPAYFPHDLHSMGPGQLSILGRNQGVPWWWGQGLEGPMGLGKVDVLLAEGEEGESPG